MNSRPASALGVQLVATTLWTVPTLPLKNSNNMTVILPKRERDRMIEIDHVLRRMDEADYIVCETCGLEISEQRLKAMPLNSSLPRLPARSRARSEDPVPR
jgi:hypothetical protein